MMVERVEMQRHLNPAVMLAVGLMVAFQAFAHDPHRAGERHLGEGAQFLAAKALRLAYADRLGLPAHACAASRSIWARLFFSAAVLSWPQAASISRPRGVRIGALIPASNTISEKRLIRSGAEHS